MATSGSSDFTMTARQIAKAALQIIGATPLGQDPEPDDAAIALEQLNLMVKTWGADPKPKLWQVTFATPLALVAGQAAYALPAARKIISAQRRVNSIDTDLLVMSRADYDSTPDKSGTGTPTSYYFDPQRATRTLYLWKVPTTAIAASTTIPYTYLRVIEDLDSLSDDFDLPQEWLEVLQYGLAARLTLPFKVHLADPAAAMEIKARAQELYGQLSAYDDESASVFMQFNNWN